MVKNCTFTNDQFWPFYFDRCVQVVQLTTVDIRINRLVPWKKLKKYHTFSIPPNRQRKLFLMQFSFRCYLRWFITLGPWSFSNDVIVNNPFLITSDNSFQKGSNSLRLRCNSQALMLFVKWISFNSCGIPISRFLTNPRRCIWLSIVDFGTFNISSNSCTVTWRSDSIMVLIC